MLKREKPSGVPEYIRKGDVFQLDQHHHMCMLAVVDANSKKKLLVIVCLDDGNRWSDAKWISDSDLTGEWRVEDLAPLLGGARIIKHFGRIENSRLNSD